ncbi:unnamed protein product [Nezara viridula]|uniref:N-acetylmuramoyl-L-alanine amidase n=1 Tax=Nezara viridula TaxID=85310 RepID=A0A9P0MNP2_NEZVI|nr:unnamed protein product [Nezara viridula]
MAARKHNSLVIVFMGLLIIEVSNLNIKDDFLRDLDSFPLPANGLAFNSAQPGKCNNFNLKNNGGMPTFIMQHHTVGNYNSTIKTFTHNNKPHTIQFPLVSSHFVIDKDGTIQRIVAEEFRAFHAGAGRFSKNSDLITLAASRLSNFGVVFNYDILHIGRGDMNSWSIGIENVNSGNEPFTKQQIEANILLCEFLCNKFPTLNPHLMVAHSDWSYNKIDPSPYFPWHEFATASQLYPGSVKRNFGVYPRKNLALKKDPNILISGDDEKNKKISLKIITIAQNLLRSYGFYIPEEESGVVGNKTKNAIFAAHVHFQGPKILNDSILFEAWHALAKSINSKSNYHLLTVLDENLLIILADCVDQLRGV